MSIRVTLCFLFVIGFSIYAWRNWFVSLCASILLMAVVQHPDMPRNIGGIQGFNPWNLLFVNVFLAWAFQRGQQGLVWDLSAHMGFLVVSYLLVVIVAALRLIIDPGDSWFTSQYIISEHIINCVKWVLPGMLLYDGCRDSSRLRIGVAVVLVLYFLLSIQVIRWVPLSAATGGGNIGHIAARMIENEIGYNRVTLSMMLGGASWATLCCLPLVKKLKFRLVLFGMAAAITLGQALTGGRTGYVSWLAVGIVLATLRWRRSLLLIPVVVGAVAIFLPGVWNRVMQGVGGREGNIVIQNDDYEMTSGRTLAWPLVLEKAREAPVFGHGREAMTTTGISGKLMEEMKESFPHPHNAYLEMLLDNGVVGFLLVIPFYVVVLARAFWLLLHRDEPLCTALGGMTCALVLALLIGATGGQTFYPREGAVGLWASLGLMLRVWVERRRSLQTGQPMFAQEEPESEPEGCEASSYAA